MVEEENFICWLKGETEGDGKEIKAHDYNEAARTAVDIWRHANVEELGGDKITVYVKDEDLNVHEVVVTQSGDSQAPEATM